MYKRLLCGVIIIIILLSVSFISVEANENIGKKKDEEVIQTRFAYIDMFVNSFDIKDNGKSVFSMNLWAICIGLNLMHIYMMMESLLKVQSMSVKIFTIEVDVWKLKKVS